MLLSNNGVFVIQISRWDLTALVLYTCVEVLSLIRPVFFVTDVDAIASMSFYTTGFVSKPVPN